MDYDDQMIYAKTILENYPDILAHFQDAFPYICVDEAQDTSKIQHAIIQLLARKTGNLFMVGDEDQSIYGFRAAYPDSLMQFEQTYIWPTGLSGKIRTAAPRPSAPPECPGRTYT